MALDSRLPLMGQQISLADIDQRVNQNRAGRLANQLSQLQVQNAPQQYRNQNRLAQLEVQGAEQGMQDRMRLRDLMPQALSGDQAARTQATAINPDLQSVFADMDENQLAQAKERNTQIGRLAAGVMQSPNPVAAYQQARQFAVERLGLSPEQIPEQYDPGFIQNAINSSREIEDLIAQKERDFQIKEGVGPDGRPMFARVSPGTGEVRPVEGISPSPKGDTAQDREIADLIKRGVPAEWAEDVARGNVATEVDQFGNVIAINRATGQVRTLRGAQGQNTSDGDDQAGGAPSVSEDRDGLFDVIEEGTGPFSKLRETASSYIGPFISGANSPDTERAKTAIRTFNQEAKTALVNNPRFPVAEQELVQKLLPDSDKVFTSPEMQRERLIQLRSFLERKMELNQQSIDSGRVTQKEVGTLSNQNAAIERVLGMMGDPEAGQSGSGDIGAMSLDQLQQLDTSNLSNEELQRAAERWDALNNGR